MTATAQDPLVALQHDLAKHRARIKNQITQLPADSPVRATLVEVEGTALAFQADALAMLVYLRDYLFGQMRAMEADFNAALDDLGADEETQFTPEDAATFIYVAQAAQRLAELSVGAPGQSADAKAELQQILKKAAEALTIVRENTLEEDDDDDADDSEDEDEDEEDVTPKGKPS